MGRVPLTSEATVTRRRGSSLATREAIEGYLYIAPWLIGFVLFILGPTIASLGLSFTRFEIVNAPVWNGLANYREALFEDPIFWQSLKVTVIFSVASVVGGLILSFLVAQLLNQNVVGLSFFRVTYYLPVLVPAVASAMVWSWAFNPDFGLFNTVLGYVGIDGPDWLGRTQWALPSIIIMSLWGIGGPMLIYLAGLQGIPTTLYEAAAIDGANAWQRFFRITIPMMTPVIFFNLVIGVISSFQVFTASYILTSGGPNYATMFYVLHLYRTGFQNWQMGYASALAWILFVIILAVTLLLLRSSEAWIYYEGRLRGR
jgi:multiple sugar transport system permease protein